MPKIARIPSLVALAKSNARRRFESQKRQLIEKVQETDAVQELLEGPGATSSAFLKSSGDVPSGNLFSFIGFYESDDPVGTLLELMDSFFKFDESAFTYQPRPRLNRIDYKFQARFPTVQELGQQKDLSLPWETGLSWIEGIENGISGVGNYLFSLERNFRTSRSGPAIQLKKEIGKRIFIPKPFLTPIFDEFRKRLAAS